MSGARGRITVAAALAATALVAVVALAWGSGDDDAGKLAWSGTPQLFKSGKPTDRVLSSWIKNASLRDIDLDTQDIRILDGEGREVRSTARFLQTFVHGLYPWSMRSENPEDLGTQERTRLGEIAKLKPGEKAPLTLSWRVPEGGSEPVRVDFGSTLLEIP
jgi:hypothetical protein